MQQLFFSVYLICSLQTQEFIKSYNQKIDPSGKLDTIQYLLVKQKHFIKSELYNTSIENTISCFHKTDGREICFEDETNKILPVGLMSINNKIYKNDLIKVLLYQLINSDENEFMMTFHSDSITKLKHYLKSGAYHDYTIDSRNYQLIEIKSVSKRSGNDFVRSTYFFDYKEIDGVNIPTRIEYSSEIAEATLYVEEISFEPFDESVFEY